jgi:lambda family phage portal protein
VVGSGIVPQCKTESNEWNEAAEAYWAEWSKVCDYRQRINMRDMQRLTIQSRLTMGDGGFVITESGQLMPVESERIATPAKLEGTAGIVDGIKIDGGTGIAVGYYIFQREADGTINKDSDKYDFVPRENFFYFSRPVRFDQVRGLPDLAPCINRLQDLKELSDSTVTKAKLDALQAWAVYTESNRGPMNIGPRGRNVEVGNTQLERVEDGMIHYFAVGEKMESLKSNTPSPEYFDFMMTNLREIGAALGLPYEFVLMDFSQSSYSSSRAALLQTYRTFTSWQEWISTQMLQKVWNWRIAKAIKSGLLDPAPKDKNGVSQWFRVQWSFPEFGWVDPQNEAAANVQEWNMGTATISSIVRKKGRDAEDVLAEKAHDIAIAERVAQEVNKEHGTQITWRDIISTTIPGQTAPSKQEAKQVTK